MTGRLLKDSDTPTFLKNGFGWLVFLPSYVLQVIIFLLTDQWFLVIQMMVLFVLSFLNFMTWEAQKNGSIEQENGAKIFLK